uniref:Uncharacterized protein n=1 Tax=Vespula pensylvanica TaxID=30213 RepID=A0A834K0J6_VESPE|nr:hypothetical protein H0235_016041 [Vespula pensylvanica]
MGLHMQQPPSGGTWDVDIISQSRVSVSAHSSSWSRMLILQWINKGSAGIKEESFFINPGVGCSSCKDQRRL